MLWSPNTQLHYPFQNTAIDYSGNARNGTVNGSGAYATKPNGGRCLYFDGTGDYVETPSFGLSGTVVVFAADVRCKIHATELQSFIGDEAFLSSLPWIWIRRPPGTYDCVYRYYNGAATSSNYFAAPYEDVWVNCCVVADYGDHKVYFYRGGILFSSATMTADTFPSTNSVKYCGLGYSGPAFPLTDGYLANVQLWSLATMPPAAQMLANANRIMLGMNPIW